MRSGGLGDFLVTLPLLAALRERGEHVTLVTRPSYRELVRDDGLVDAFVGVDDASLTRGDLAALAAGARVLSFEGALATRFRDAGAADVVRLEPRPTGPPHVAARALRDAGLPVPGDLLERSVLDRGPEPPDARTLFLHPGSGSPAKNAPLAWFVERARRWPGSVVVTLGEADAALVDPCRRELGGDALWIEPALRDLRARLAREAAGFAGNDTGPTHLAAALGIATTARFVASDPEVWRPLGRAVRVERVAA